MIGVIQGLCIGICTQTRNYWKVKLFFDATEVIKTSSTSCGYMKMDFSDQSKTQRILQSLCPLCLICGTKISKYSLLFGFTHLQMQINHKLIHRLMRVREEGKREKIQSTDYLVQREMS